MYIGSPELTHQMTESLLLFLNFIFIKYFIYLFMRDREAETQAEGEAGSMQGARHGTLPWVSRITPWAEGGAKPLSHLAAPSLLI